MRRGHPGAGGWRGENPRCFRPRGSGPPNFRPSRHPSLLDSSRFPLPGPHQYRGPRPFSQRPGRQDNAPQLEHHDRNVYQLNNNRNQGGYHNRDRQMPPYHHQSRQIDDSYGESNYYKNPNQCHVNNMGDIDHRRQHTVPPWANPPPNFDNNRQFYGDHRSPHKTPGQLNMGDDLPDYSGHRPPASDHYTTTTGPNNNSSQYSHSVDDTVDIVRKRLQNRDKQQIAQPSMEHQNNTDEDLRKNTEENFQNVPQEQPVRRRTTRQKNIKSNCDKMKNNIVHQLFKMDKTKIHKLMDDPSSSSKFEYAISSLITEGQNSLNRHLRSAAEKSLSSSSSDFIQGDTNTIYEDIFMKQMQGILDPQDTVLLEDIKPLVMAELSRVLQLDEHQFELMQEHGYQNQNILDHEIYNQGQDYTNEQEIYDQPNQYYDDSQNDHYGQDYYDDASVSQNNIEVITGDLDSRTYEHEQEETKPLFERRPTNRVNEAEKRRSAASRHSRNSLETGFEDQQKTSDRYSPKEKHQTIPLFDANADTLSNDDDDPFAELDNQYHVAVDHNFMEYSSRPASPSQSLRSTSDKSPSYPSHSVDIGLPKPTTSSDIKKEIDAQLHNIATSPVKVFEDSPHNTEPKTKSEINIDPVQVSEKENLLANISCEHTDIGSKEESSKKKEVKKEPEKHDSTASSKSVLQSNTRKRSTDQKPSHRKEKHKRSSQSDSQEAAKSIMNMFYAHDDSKGSAKPSKISDPSSKTYSDKYVKRKEHCNKSRDKESESAKSTDSKKHNNSTSSSHSILSPKDSSNEPPPKSDAKTKLKPIDIFGTQPKKTNAHQAHRNTAQVTTPQVTTPQSAQSPEEKPKLIVPCHKTSFARKLSKRHIGTQVEQKVKNRDSQTNRLKTSHIHTQTDSVTIKSQCISTNPLERMKEIDLEIQLLLEEKFKLYNSLETKAAEVPMDTIPNLSMRVFKVNTETTDEKSDEAADAIVDEFTSIPAEELEQIAMETIAEQTPSASKASKRNRRKKVREFPRKSSASPSIKRQSRKAKSPNISLIEQIITDDRPIEDIISLDDLETTPVKSKRKQQKSAPKKSSKKQKAPKTVSNMRGYDIKECSIILERININKYMKQIREVRQKRDGTRNKLTFEEPIISPVNEIPIKSEETVSDMSDSLANEVTHSADVSTMVQVVDDVVNDLQFDMLDVSEDIVIGDNCEAKTIDNVKEVISEEIILDNSQSSMEDGAPEPTGTENECKMYDYSNENLRRDAVTVTGNADAVLAIECIDDDFIAACLDGNVYHFGADGQLLNTLRGTNQAVTCLTIVKEKYGTTVYTGSLDSRMRYYDLETGLEKGPECNVLSPIQTMDRAWDTIFVGTRTGFVLQFECKNNMVIPVSTVKFSEQSILALRAMKEGPRKVLLVAARSENVVTVKDAQTGLLLRTLQGPKMTVYTLLYEDGKVYCGTSSHNIHVFDYSSGAHVGSHSGGKGAVCLRASGGLVFAGCYDGCVYVYREGEARPRAQLRGPSLMLLSLAIHGTKIIAGYKDRGLYIWKMPLAIVQEMIL